MSWRFISVYHIYKIGDNREMLYFLEMIEFQWLIYLINEHKILMADSSQLQKEQQKLWVVCIGDADVIAWAAT